MIRRSILATLSALLLLGSIVGTTLAASRGSRVQVGTPMSQPLALSVARSYTTSVTAGMQTGDFSRLAALLAPAAILTQHSTITPLEPQMDTRAVQGRSAILAVYHALYRWAPGLQWTQEAMSQVSPTVVETFAHATAPRLGMTIQSQQRLVIRHGKIVRLDWILQYFWKSAR
jgi:hypothetical protein